MSTLKMFFGRPEHILERMIDKVRKLAAPKEKLESITEYALYATFAQRSKHAA